MSDAGIRAACDALASALIEALADKPTTAPAQLFGVAQAATQLGIGRSTAYAEIARGRLKSLKVGRRRLISAEALSNYIREVAT